MFEEPSCLVTLFVDGREMSADELREPETLAEVGARPAPASTTRGTELPTDFDSFRLVRGVRRERRASTAASRPDGYDEALEAAGAIEKAVARPADARAGPGPQRPAPANFLRDGDQHPADRLGVRRDGRPLVRPRQLRGQQRARRRAGGAAARGLLRRAAGRAAARDAEAVPLHVGLPRGDVGRRAGGRVRARLRLRRVRAEALRPPGEGAAATRASRAGSRRPAA